MIHHLHVGIDVSKDTLDISASFDGQSFRTLKVSNDGNGFGSLFSWLNSQSEPEYWRVGLEATSAYHRLLVRFFEEKDVRILVLNPRQARDLAKGLGIIRKDDQVDARVLSIFMQMGWREPHRQPSQAGQRLQEISRRIDVLVRLRSDEKRRLQKPGSCRELLASVKRNILWLGKEIAKLEQEWLECLDGSEELLRSYALALGLPGVGHKTARVVVSEMCACPRERSVRQCVSFAGLAPHSRTSGTSLRKPSRTARSGNKRLKTALYMGVVSMIKRDAECRDLYMRILGQGKPQKVALVAVMNKMMRRLAAVLNRGTPWVKT